jgi:hypothetical protein
VLALGAVVVGTIPLVNGTFVASAAPAKATAWVVAVTMGVAVVFAGLITLIWLLASFYHSEPSFMLSPYLKAG